MIAGVDEAGRGPLAGPVVAAAVILPDGFVHSLIRDSKKLTEAQRLEAREVVQAHALCWNLGIGTVARIEQENILQATFFAMHEAIDGLPETPTQLLVDGNRFRSHAIPHTCIVKGDDKEACIGAASILAKTYRDEIMQMLDALHPQYGWRQNKGYPTKAHKLAVQEWGPTPWHRKSFRGATLF